MQAILSISGIHLLFCIVCFVAGIIKWKGLNAADKIILSVVLAKLLQYLVLVITSTDIANPETICNPCNVLIFALFLLYFSVKAPQRWIRVFSFFLIPVFTIWGIINFVLVQGAETFNTLTYIPAALVVGLFSYLNLRRLIIADSISKHNMQLWFLIANCLYFFVNIPIEGMGPFIEKFAPDLAEKLEKIPDIFEFVWLIMITLGFVWKKRSRI